MRGLERLRRETVSHPDAPWALEHGQREEVQDQGEVASDEDYEYQVALALSQSANDANLALAQQEAENIAHVTRQSLLPLASGRSTGQADALSYKLWDSDCLNYDDKVCDGLYDVRGEFPELSSRGGGLCFPTLAELKTIEPAPDDHREVVIIDHDQDPGLCAVDERAADAITACIRDGPIACIQALAQVVANQLGGRCSHAELYQRYGSCASALKAKRQSIALPIGALTVGLARHRALLFKALADFSELPCRLLRGQFYLGPAGLTGDAAIVMVHVNGKEIMVDLVADPGTVYPVVPDTIPKANPPPVTITTFSSPQTGSSAGTPAIGLDGFDGDMEGPDLIPIKEEPGSQEWSMVSSADAAPGPSGSGHATRTSSGGVHAARSSSGSQELLRGSSRDLTRAGDEGHIAPISSWVNTGLSSPSPFEASGLQSAAFEFREPASSSSTTSSGPADSSAWGEASKPQQIPIPVSHQQQQQQPPFATPSAATELIVSMPHLVAGRGADSAFHAFESPGDPRAAIITQAMNGVRRRPPLPRHSISDLGPHSIANIPPFDSPIAPVLELPHARPAEPEAQAVAPARTSSNLQRQSLPVPSAGGLQMIRETHPRPLPPRPPDTPPQLEPMLNAPPSEQERQQQQQQQQQQRERVSSNAQASGSGGRVAAPNLHRVSPAARLTEVAAIPNAPSEDLPITPRTTLKNEMDEWEIAADEIELGPRIGIGSYGEVYRGMWRHTDVAVKRLLEQDLTPQLMEEFRAEVAIMKRLKHPNVVLFMGACTQPPNLSIITQFVPRGSLFRLLHRTPQIPLDERRKVRMALDVAKGMNYLHSCRPPIVHRDLKSPNLLVDKDFTVKVCDFGLSRVRRSTWMTNKSQAGTPEWTAPEVLRSQSYNEKSDVYSMGVILWELLTNEEPWGDKTAMQVVGAVGWGNARLPIPDDAPEDMRLLIEQCWAEPAQRPSFSDIIKVLNRLDH